MPTTSRDIITALLQHRIPERVGLHEHFWPHMQGNGWDGVSDYANRFGLDMQSIFWCCAPGPRPDLARTVHEDEERKTTVDGWGASFTYWKHKGGTPEHIGFACDSRQTWERDFRDAFRAIDPRNHVNLPEMRQQYGQAMAGDRFVTFSGIAVFEELRRILGDVGMLENMAADPDFISDFCTTITDYQLRWWDLVLREVGRPDGIHIYEDLGYTRGPFCSPRMHRQLILPHHKRLFGFFKQQGLPLIVHTCGDFRPHLPALAEAGADCIQALEAKTGMDVLELARDWKDRLCFMGNLDVRAFESGERTRIRDEVTRKLDGMKRLRAPWIFMSDHSIPPTVKIEDYAYALDLYRANCRY